MPTIDRPQVRRLLKPAPRAKVAALALLSALLTAAGCPPRSQGGKSPQTEIQELRDRIAVQDRQIEMQKAQIEELSNRLQHLQGAKSEQHREGVSHVAKIQLATLSGGYDEDHDGADEGIVLYLAPIDADGDVVKASGAVQVRLLDLTGQAARQDVGAASISGQELRGLWFGKLGAHYTIKVPWTGGAKRPPARTITALVTFQDYQSGKTFSLQQAFEVHGAAGVGAGPATSSMP